MKSATIVGIATAAIGVFMGTQLSQMWSMAKRNAVLSGQMSLAVEVMRVQGEIYDKKGRYVGEPSAILKDRILYRDGSSPKMLDEMVYHCDTDGQRFIAILGVDFTPVLIRGRQGEEWLGRNALEAK